MADSRARLTLVIVSLSLAAIVGAAVASLTNAHEPVPTAVLPSTLHVVPRVPTHVASPGDSSRTIMIGLIDPAADGIWNSIGSITTAESDEQWAPSTDADWKHLEGHAQAIVRGAAALSEPERSGGREDWLLHARALRAAGRIALDAARRRNPNGLEVASEALLDACQQCHARYWLPVEHTP